jgi:hypothetical protein
MGVRSVNVSHIHQVWDDVKPYLDKAMSHSGGEYTTEHLKLYLTEGRQSLLVITNDDEQIIGAIAVELINFPDERIVFITSIGGTTSEPDWQEFISWCKYNGATMIRGAAFEAVARLWKSRYGFESRYVMVEKKI